MHHDLTGGRKDHRPQPGDDAHEHRSPEQPTLLPQPFAANEQEFGHPREGVHETMRGWVGHRLAPWIGGRGVVALRQTRCRRRYCRHFTSIGQVREKSRPASGAAPEVKALGLEPRTNGLKVRCSTN